MGMTDVEVEQHDKLNSIIETLNKDDTGNIVLIGDIMLDCYIHGYANNLNSRAPVPVLRETHREEDVGAAAHVCLLYTSPSPRDKRQSRMPSSA